MKLTILLTSVLIMGGIVSSPASAAILKFEFSGSVTEVDTPLDSLFSVADTMLFSFEIDSTLGVDTFGINASGWDSTVFAMTNRHFEFSNGYQSTSSGTNEAARFWDYYFPTTYTNGFRHEDHNMAAPDVAGLSKSQIWFNFGLLDNTLDGLDDAVNNIAKTVSLNALQNIDGSDIGPYQDSKLSFQDSNGRYHYVDFDITNIGVTNLSNPNSSQNVPEPSTLSLLGLILLGLGYRKYFNSGLF